MEKSEGKHDLIFFENRSTPQVVERGAEAKSKKGYGKQTSRRKATPDEEKQISAGRWVRVDQSGNRPNSPEYKKTRYRPGLLKKSNEPTITALFAARAGLDPDLLWGEKNRVSA